MWLNTYRGVAVYTLLCSYPHVRCPTQKVFFFVQRETKKLLVVRGTKNYFFILFLLEDPYHSFSLLWKEDLWFIQKKNDGDKISVIFFCAYDSFLIFFFLIKCIVIMYKKHPKSVKKPGVYINKKKKYEAIWLVLYIFYFIFQ